MLWVHYWYLGVLLHRNLDLHTTCDCLRLNIPDNFKFGHANLGGLEGCSAEHPMRLCFAVRPNVRVRGNIYI